MAVTKVNSMVEIPLFKKSPLLFAYRQKYYNLYKSGAFNIFSPTHVKPSTESNSTPLTIALLDNERNKQLGISDFYHKKWSDNLVSKFVLTISDFSISQTEKFKSKNTSTQLIFNQ